ALADLVRQQRLPDAEHAGHDRNHDHPAREQREPVRVVLRDRLQDAAQEERRYDAERRRDEDQAQDRAESRAVGAEERGDAPQVVAADGWVAGTIGPLAAVSERPWHAVTVEKVARLAP